mmetsp:Transcript_22128/g.41160  ORF Transcript_22128/g.41160 Transcript_22128/m.41160 type:complete len:80 (-) Transcript_22128:321-560(-)
MVGAHNIIDYEQLYFLLVLLLFRLLLDLDIDVSSFSPSRTFSSSGVRSLMKESSKVSETTSASFASSFAFDSFEVAVEA